MAAYCCNFEVRVLPSGVTGLVVGLPQDETGVWLVHIINDELAFEEQECQLVPFTRLAPLRKARLTAECKVDPIDLPSLKPGSAVVRTLDQVLT